MMRVPLVRGVSLFLFQTILVSTCFGQTPWQPLAPLPAPNGGFACAIIDGKILTIGGTNWSEGVKHWLGDVWTYDPASNHWTRDGTMETPLAYSAFASSKAGFFLIGGGNQIEARPEVLQWKGHIPLHAHTKLPFPTMYATAAAGDDGLYVVGGGSDVTDMSRLTDSFLRVDTITGHVEQLPPYPAGKVMLPAVVAVPGRILVFGGRTFDTEKSTLVNLDSAFAYDIDSRAWHSIQPYPAARCGLAACALDDDRILIGGGYGVREPGNPDEGMSEQLFLYTLSKNHYERLPPMPYSAMGQGLLKQGSSVYLFGGEDVPRHRSDRLYRCEWQDLIRPVP